METVFRGNFCSAKFRTLYLIISAWYNTLGSLEKEDPHWLGILVSKNSPTTRIHPLPTPQALPNSVFSCNGVLSIFAYLLCSIIWAQQVPNSSSLLGLVPCLIIFGVFLDP